VNDILTTDQKREAAKRLLRLLDTKPLSKPNAVKKLTSPVKVKKANGTVVEKERIYKSNGDAKEVVKDLVEHSNSPIQTEDEKLIRTDTIYGGKA
jgi:hypothetical protein